MSVSAVYQTPIGLQGDYALTTPGAVIGGLLVRQFTEPLKALAFAQNPTYAADMSMFASAARNTAVIVLAGLVQALSGCAPKAEVVLHQPFAPPSQQELKLASNWAFEAAAGGRRIWLLEFPLPSSPDGPRDFHLYLSTPDADQGFLGQDFIVDQSSSTGVRGFLIQEVGQLRGKTQVATGQVRVTRSWLDWRRRLLEVNLACNDGTQIIGRALADPLASEIAAFERRYSGDVAALAPPEDTRELAADEVPDRATASP